MPSKTIIATTERIDKTWRQSIEKLDHIEILILKQIAQGHINLSHLLDVLGQREISSLLIEGGMKTHELFFQENLVNQFHVYIAPIIIGSLATKQIFNNMHITSLAQDACIKVDAKENLYV